MSANPLPEGELLLKFEQDNLPEKFKEYYSAKRQNLFASVQGLKDLFDAFMLLDKILLRELEDTMTSVLPVKMFPIVMFINAQAKMRIALELAFSCCLPEAHSIVRDAIESVAHGHRMVSDPALIAVWLQKGESKATTLAFKDAFWNDKGQTERLFDGLPELLRLWKRFSESGSHTNPNSLYPRFALEDKPESFRWAINYTGTDSALLVCALFEMLLVFSAMENVFFADHAGRLKLDIELDKMRMRLHREQSVLRAKYNSVMQPQTAPSTLIKHALGA
jgi:hypothetical protein